MMEHMRVHARVSIPGVGATELEPGDIIGRLASARFYLNDPRISEAHAMVSLRQTSLRLLALRGRLSVGGAPVTDATLVPGQEIELAPGIVMRVHEVVLPAAVLALETAGRPLQVLPSVASVYEDGTVVLGFASDADAIFWFDSEGLNVRTVDRPDARVDEGDRVMAGARELRIVAAHLDAAGVASTLRGEASAALRLVLKYDTVHVFEDDTIRTIDGLPARLVCELAQMQGPVEWRTVAREVWPGEDDEALLRRKFDALLSRLRRRLRELGIRGDLVRTDGRGRFELMLGPRDVVEDQM